MLSEIQALYIMIKMVYLTYLREESSSVENYALDMLKKGLLFACHLLITVIYILK